MSCFIKKGGSQNNNVQRYYCRRSGIYKSRGTKKRHLKIQGSCKVGTKCLASITAICSSKGTNIYLLYIYYLIFIIYNQYSLYIIENSYSSLSKKI